MNHRIFVSLFLAGLFAACTNNNQSTENHTDSTTTQTPVMVDGCYAFSAAKDTIWLHLQPQAQAVTGTLNYRFFEKDSNNGTIQGVMQGDTLFADYTFASEGVTSVREVAFMKKDNGFVEGYGETEEKDGKTVFKNRSALKFDSQTKLSPVACP